MYDKMKPLLNVSPYILNAKSHLYNNTTVANNFINVKHLFCG